MAGIGPHCPGGAGASGCVVMGAQPGGCSGGAEGHLTGGIEQLGFFWVFR